MKQNVKPWLGVMMALAALLQAAPAAAQLSAQVTSNGTLTVTAGTYVSNAGTITVTNNGISAVSISSVTVQLSNPGAFNSISLVGTIGGTSQTANFSSPGSSNTANFSLPDLAAGAQATFTLSAQTSSGSSTSMVTPSGGAGWIPQIYAATVGSPARPKDTPLRTLVLLAVWIAALSTALIYSRQRRRDCPTGISSERSRQRWIAPLLVLMLIAAVSAIGCGNQSIFGGSSGGGGGTTSSTQTISAITASSGTVSGLPATLGTITVQ